MKIYKLTVTCPYYGDIGLVGIYSTNEKLEQAKEIAARCSGIDDYVERFSVDEIELDKLPYDYDQQ